MQMLWIGCLESDEEFENKAKKGYDLASAQVSQKNLINGIEEVSGYVFDSINGSVLPPYPIYEDRVIEQVVWSHLSGTYDVSVGYKNDKYINRINCKKSMLDAAEEWISNRYLGGELVALVYSMRSAPMSTACYIKKKIPTAKIYLIVSDLPQFMDLGQNSIKTFLKKIDWVFIKSMQKRFDGFILYAEKMHEYLNIPNGKWMLMEGSYDISDRIEVTIKQKAIMYSGKLDEQYGIKMLIEAFMQLEGDFELWLTGGGNAEDYIRDCVQKDSRIKFYGFLPSRKEVLRKQAEASFLINMRLPSEKASDYCFPSKLFEYMATGTPVLSFDIGGIPREYLQYLCLISDVSVSGIKQAITYNINNFEQAVEKGEMAKEYILHNKNTQKQCEKVYDFVKKGSDYEKDSNH